MNVRSRAVPIVLCLLVLLAGCASLPGMGGTDSEAYSPPGEPLNATQLEADHSESVASLDSFRITVVQEIRTGNGSIASNQSSSVAVNRERDRALVVQRLDSQQPSRETTRYRTENRTYERRVVGNRTATNVVPAERRQERNWSSQLRLSSEWETIDGINWTQNGTETFDGVTVTRYSASGIEENAAAMGVQNTDTIRSFGATLLVTSDGSVRRMAGTITAEANGRVLTNEFRYDLTGFDETTVETPGWVNATGNASSNA